MICTRFSSVSPLTHVLPRRYLAMACALEDLGAKNKNERALLLGKTLMEGVGQLLDNRKSPGRKVPSLCLDTF